MTDGPVPEDARQFLLKTIDSIAQWEGLLLLRAHPGEAWDALSIAGHLYITEMETVFLMARLAEHQIVALTETPQGLRYTYNPATTELTAAIDRVAQLYKDYLIPVTRIIHSKPRNRVQEFANAFRIRKD
jgi:hypothetical protein